MKYISLVTMLFLIGCDDPSPDATAYKLERKLAKGCINTDFIYEWRGEFFYERTMSSTYMRKTTGPDACQ